MKRLLFTLWILCLVARAQPISGPASATTNAVPSYLDNKHLKDNPLVTIVGGHLFIAGAPVLTNAPSGITFAVNGTASTAPNLADTATLLARLVSTNVSFYPTNLADDQIASAAAIGQSKISGLTTDLAAKIANSSGTGTNTSLVAPSISGATMSGTTTNTSTFQSQLPINGGTQTASLPVLDLWQTWNNGGVTFTGIKFNVTNTASVGSLLIDLQASGSSRFKVDINGNGTFAGNSTIASSGYFIQSGRAIFSSPVDGVHLLQNNAANSYTRLDFGGTTATFPAWTRTAAGFTLTGADGTANSTNSLFVPGIIQSTNGIASLDTTAAVNGSSGGWTNTFGKAATCYVDGTAVTFTVKNNAGTAVWTNATAFTGCIPVPLQSGGAVITSGTGVTTRGVPF